MPSVVVCTTLRVVNDSRGRCRCLQCSDASSRPIAFCDMTVVAGTRFGGAFLCADQPGTRRTPEKRSLGYGFSSCASTTLSTNCIRCQRESIDSEQVFTGHVPGSVSKIQSDEGQQMSNARKGCKFTAGQISTLNNQMAEALPIVAILTGLRFQWKQQRIETKAVAKSFFWQTGRDLVVVENHFDQRLVEVSTVTGHHVRVRNDTGRCFDALDSDTGPAAPPS